MPLINASAPDARFIYEAVDAAKSLLTTFNNFVDPETLRYMPSPSYLFIIYSAVFLYKARSTTTMTEDERIDVKRMINQTIERLQKASMGSNHMGSRYARLLTMLWRKAPKHTDPRGAHHQTIDTRIQGQGPPQDPNDPGLAKFDPNQQFMGMNQRQMGLAPPGTFSWLDLGATWNFATQNNHSASASSADIDDASFDTGMSPFNMNLLTDYSLLEGDNPNLIF
jgi:hypothetical protein